MKVQKIYPIILFYSLSLAGCTSTSTTEYTPYGSFDFATIHDYPQSDNMPSGYRFYPIKTVVVPETYHVGSYRAPTSHKEKDRQWVDTQNPENYTIQISDDEKAAHVANQLILAPKNERRAEIKYHKEGKTYYKGVYGSYKTRQEAEKALENLPPNLKQGAGIKNWGTVQKDAQD